MALAVTSAGSAAAPAAASSPRNAGGPGGRAELAVPCAPGSAQPGLSAGADGVLRLSWVEPRGEEHALVFAPLGEEGWGEPVVAAQGRDWFVNWADVPALAADAEGRLLACWLRRAGEATYAYHVLARLSPDGGRTWGEPWRLHADDSPTEHGFVALVPREAGFLALWLDGRALAEGDDGDGGDGDGRGEERATQVRARAVGPDGSLAPEQLLDGRACDCCATALAIVDGEAVAAWRDRSADEVRDVSFAVLAGDSWSEPRGLHADGWEIAGCPVNGPSLAARGGRVGAAWYTAAGGGAGAVRAWVGPPEDLGAWPVAVDGGRPLGRAAVALLPGGELAVAWLEEAGEAGARWHLRLVGADLATSEATVLATVPAQRSSGFARLAPHGDGLVFAWTDPGPPTRVHTLVLAADALPRPRTDGDER